MKPALVLLAGLLTACTVGPNYVPPRVELPPNWTEHAATPAEIARTNQELRQWWTSFDDLALDRLVDTALTGNIDLKIAGQRLIEARAARVIAASADYPQIDAGALASDKQVSNTVLFPPVTLNRSNCQFYQVGFDTSWELDIFGGIRRAKQAAEAEYGATIEARRAALGSLLAELAIDYASLRASQERLSIAERNVAAARSSLEVTEQRGVSRNWWDVAGIDMTGQEMLTWGSSMRWVLRLIETGMASEVAGADVMEISRPDGASDIADLGLTLSEAKQLLACVQQAIVAAQAGDLAARRPECSSCSGRCHVNGWRCPLLATPFGKVTVQLPRFRCVSCGHIERCVTWPSHCRSTPELDRLRAHLSALMA